MKQTLLLLSLLLCLAVDSASGQTRTVLKQPPNGAIPNALLEPLSTGANVFKISATGTLEWVNGATLTGGSYLKTALGMGNVENTAISTWVGSTNQTTLGTITTGVWQGTAITDTYISSAATWNAKESALTFSTGLSRSGNTITLATSGITAGSYGSSTQVARYTVDAYGRITAVSAQTITPAVGAITGMGANVSAWLITPTKANLNAAVSDDDPAYVGAANTFAAANTFSGDVTIATGKGIYFGAGANYWRTDAYNSILFDSNMVVGRSGATGNTWGFENGGGFYFGRIYAGGSGQIVMNVTRDYVMDVKTFSSSQAASLAVYNMMSSSTNYEAGVLDWLTTTNTLRIGSDVGSGGGTARDVSVIHGGVEKMHVSSGGVAVGITGTTHAKIKSGVATLVAGTVTVSDSDVLETGTAATSSRILVARMTDGGTLGTGYSITRVNTTSFTITSTSSAETSTLSWVIFNP